MKSLKTYRVEITRSQTLTFLVQDTSALGAISKASEYARIDANFCDKPHEITRRYVSIVKDGDKREAADVDLTVKEQS